MMNPSLLVLIHVLIGVAGVNLFSYLTRKKYFGLIGNTIAGVFGSVFFSKIFDHLGVSPLDIINDGTIKYPLFILYILISIVGAIVFLLIFNHLIRYLKNRTK